MFRKLFFLTLFILVCGLNSAARAVSIDVNNYSFEYDVNGEFITKQININDVAGWTLRDNSGWGAIWWLFATAETDPNLNYVNFEATDGNVAATSATLDTPGYTVEIYQILEDGNAIIRENHRYTMTFDALGSSDINTPDVNGVLFYSIGDGEANDVILANNRVPLTAPTFTELDYAGWQEIKVVYTALTGSSSIGERLGVKLSSPGYPVWLDGVFVFMDNVRVEGGWASDAWNPIPVDKAINVPLNLASLSWSPGLWADEHKVYLGTNFEDVNNREGSTLITPEPVDVNNVAVPMTLQLGEEYFWMVEEVNESYVRVNPANMPPEGPWVGPVWSFKTNDGKAFNFSPYNNEKNVASDVVLKWSPGEAAATHDLYLSTNFDDVESRDPAVKVSIEPNYWGPLDDLDLDGIYYWAVDEVNESVAGSPWQGMMLSFTVIDYRVVDDMDSYATDDALKAVWKDYWFNDTGAEVSINYTDANFVRDGNSMFYEYDNMYKDSNSNYGSMAKASVSDLEIGQDWTAKGVKALTLYFYGISGNSATVNDRMYVALSDGTDVGVLYYPDVNALTEEKWHEWNINLQDYNDAGVDLTDVSKIAVGFGVYGGSGTKGGRGDVYFDDIRLNLPRCFPDLISLAGDIDDDCVVDGYDLEIMANDWLLGDYDATPLQPPNAPELWYRFDEGTGTMTANSGDLASHDITFPGLPADPLWTTDVAPALDQLEPNYALDFDGSDDYLEIPNSPALPFVGIQNMTITAWIKPTADMDYDWPSIVESRNSADTGDASGLGFGNWGELIYFWNNDYWDFTSGLWAGTGVWSFVAVAVEPTQATLYLYDGGSLASATHAATHGPMTDWDTGFNNLIGVCPVHEFFNGKIDDIRIYDYTLSRDNIMYIANMPTYVPLASPANLYDEELPYSKYINLRDFAVLAGDWLTEVLWP